jgi:hypothetical protein
VTGVTKWLDDESNLPDTVLRANFYPTRLLSLKTRNSAAYKGVMAQILSLGAQDFISGKTMDFAIFTYEYIDIHHLFPRDYCKKKGYPITKVNSVVNRTPLSARTNKVIGSASPQDYLKRLTQNHNISEDSLKSLVSSHQVDYEDLSTNNFDGFFIKRAKAILTMIGKAMGKPVQDLGSEDVVNEFGQSLR